MKRTLLLFVAFLSFTCATDTSQVSEAMSPQEKECVSQCERAQLNCLTKCQERWRDYGLSLCSEECLEQQESCKKQCTETANN
jgi:hypothetical protein